MLSWKQLRKPWQQMDYLVFLLPIVLTILGGFVIRSTEFRQHLTDYWQHWTLGGLGIVLMLSLSRWRYEALLRWHWITYGLTNAMLLAVMFKGTTALGAQRWISIAGFNVQPSEFAKLGMIITLAALLHRNTAPTLLDMTRILAITGVPWLLVFVQPDLGTSLVFGAIAMGMLYWSNVSPGWLLLLIAPILSAILFNVFHDSGLVVVIGWVLGLGWIAWSTLPWQRLGALITIAINLIAGELGHLFWGLLKDYQKDRLILFLNPDKDPLGGGYHLIQSRIAIGSGELWGEGLNHGTQTQLNFIPEQHTDFIFSAIGEELGFVGSITVLVLFWLLCLRLIIVAQNAKDNFGSLLVIGILSMLVFQIFINVGMTIGIAPVTGIPLPWISYGRSAILTNFIAIGLVEAVATARYRSKF